MTQGDTRPPAIGALAEAAGKVFPLEVLKSGAGYYIGTLDTDGMPFSRESFEYWSQASDAETALQRGLWRQRREP